MAQIVMKIYFKIWKNTNRYFTSVRIRIGFNAVPDPAFYVYADRYADLDTDSEFKVNADRIWIKILCFDD
jgi:hypothetical protein